MTPLRRLLLTRVGQPVDIAEQVLGEFIMRPGGVIERWRGVSSAAATLLVSLALVGCAIVDQFSDRAVVYNVQAEELQQQGLLMNIVRAALRRPMQFTTLQSITGTANASGSINGGFTHLKQTPYISLFGLVPPASSGLLSSTFTGAASANASMSGGPTFTVPVLDTQEFYQGLLQPIAQSVIDYYIQLGFPRELLVELFYGTVDIYTAEGGCVRSTVNNKAGNEVQRGQFLAIVDYLLVSGITVEQVSDKTNYGPPISYDPRTRGAEDTAKMVEAFTKASAAGLNISKEGSQVRLEKSSTKYRSCFALQGSDKPYWLGLKGEQSYCGRYSARKQANPEEEKAEREEAANRAAVPRTPAPSARGNGCGINADGHGILLSDIVLKRIAALQSRAAYSDRFPVEAFAGRHVTFKFYPRSVEGILYHLGEVTRAQIKPDHGDVRAIRIKAPLRDSVYPVGECNPALEAEPETVPVVGLGRRRVSYADEPNCENLFMLERGIDPNAVRSVNYDGENYFVSRDPKRAGRTMQVLELVKQLLALNTSSKQLPQTTVISIIGGSSQ